MVPPEPRSGNTVHPHKTRIILAFDLDNMYVACERLRDPSLVGKPVGVRQKGLLATSSYEARALGVDKLCPLWEAKKRCPSLIIVDGEDLTLYRYYSRRVFTLVRSVLKPVPVEKLGLDELFCDVTDIIASHLSELRGESTDPRGVWFTLDPTTAVPENKGFWYRPADGCPGHTIPASTSTSTAAVAASPAMIAASYLAQHIRHLILSQIGLASSAGIAHSKTVAKLVGNLHKPNMQTTLAVSPDAAELYGDTIRELLDPLEAKKLMGFGSKVRQVLHVHASTLVEPTTSSDSSPADPPALTVQFLRTHFTSPLFSSLLGSNVGPKLWALLEGIDDEPVKASPDFPLTISIEDSFDEKRGGLDWSGVLREIAILAKSLLRRLEIELVDGGELDGSPRVSLPDAAPRKWQRYPTQLRLTIRTGHSRDVPYHANRESRSAPFPVPAFDLSVARDERAQALVKHPLSGLAKQVLDKGGKATEGKFDICIINIAVTNLQTTTPTQAINMFFAAESQRTSSTARDPPITKRPRSPRADIDLAMLSELPEDIRVEILREYGLSADNIPMQVKRAKQSHGVEERHIRPQATVSPSCAPLRDSCSPEVDNAMPEWEDSPPESDEEDEDGGGSTVECERCGARVFGWSLHAHLAFHDLP